MKRKILTICLLGLISLCGCKSEVEANMTLTGRFEQCPGYTDLYYDVNTSVVYVVESGYYRGYMSPYYSSHGCLYSWNGIHLVEIREN